MATVCRVVREDLSTGAMFVEECRGIPPRLPSRLGTLFSLLEDGYRRLWGYSLT